MDCSDRVVRRRRFQIGDDTTSPEVGSDALFAKNVSSTTVSASHPETGEDSICDRK